jgi:hypothetical protein
MRRWLPGLYCNQTRLHPWAPERITEHGYWDRGFVCGSESLVRMSGGCSYLNKAVHNMS